MADLLAQGVAQKHVDWAIDAFRAGATVASAHFSRSTYVLSLQDNTLWDMKAVVVKASELSLEGGENLEPILPAGFITHAYIPSLLRYGFPIVVFDELDGARKLGLRGFDPAALNEPHKVHMPNGQGFPNGAAGTESENSEQLPERRPFSGMRSVRNSENVRTILRSAGGKCASCGNKTFKTKSGTWFLEVHHKTWLSDGGPDTVANMVALCPNCHRQEHFGERRYWGDALGLAVTA